MKRWDCVKQEDLYLMSMEEIIFSMKHLYKGVWVRSDGGHPCGWDFVDLSTYLNNFESIEEFLEDEIASYDISEGYGNDDDIRDKTIREFFAENKGFWLDGLPEDSFVTDDKYAYKWNGELKEEI